MDMHLWNSRRSPVYSLNGIAASSQPLATAAGVRILQANGNAADAAVAIAAALNVTEPCSTGIGGDCFVLYFDAKTKKVHGLLGNGRSPAALTLDKVQDALGMGDRKPKHIPQFHPYSVTVPGAAAGWCDTVEHFGSKNLSLEDILKPAVELAENGFPVSCVASHFWKKAESDLKKAPNGHELLVDGQHAPAAGTIFRNPNLASTFRLLGQHGKTGFYQGRIAEAITAVLESVGGNMTLADLQNHTSELRDPISVNYRGVNVYEIGPPTQGAVALETLNILENFDIKSMGHNSEEYLHHLIEALRFAFEDAAKLICDPQVVSVPIEEHMLSKSRAKDQASNIVHQTRGKGVPEHSSDTVQFCVVDKDGNACSMINSNYMGFGSHIVPPGCGFSLQNRGSNFSLVPGHVNCVGPSKRPYHTIIPAMATEKGELLAAFGVMGGFMQPQGHVQVLVNMVDFGMNPQEALDAARICLPAPHHHNDGDDRVLVVIEQGISKDIGEALKQRGHMIEGPLQGFDRSIFGRGQIITRNSTNGVLCAGSDPRADGCAFPC